MYKDDNNRSDQMKKFTNNIAEKLGVPTEKLAAAMQSVRKEWMDQMITEKIQEVVQIREWLKNRPEGVQKLIGQMFGHMDGMMGMRMGMHM